MKRRLFQILVAFGQNGFLLGFTNKAIYQGSLKEYCTPTLNCYACPGAIFACPIGTIQHFAVVGGAIPAYVMGYLAAIGAVVGRMCCGWLCPFGFFQDLLYKVRSVKIAIPKALTYAKYLILAGLVFTVSSDLPGALVLEALPRRHPDRRHPLVAARREHPRDAREDVLDQARHPLALRRLVRRPPSGRSAAPPARSARSSRSSTPSASTRCASTTAPCTRCDRCRENCPMDISIWQNERSVDCIRCLECTACPVVSYKTVFENLPAAAPANSPHPRASS